MDDITAKRIEQKLDKVLATLGVSHNEEAEFTLSEEAGNLRTALNNLIGAIVNKKIEGLDEDLEEARGALEAKCHD